MEPTVLSDELDAIIQVAAGVPGIYRGVKVNSDGSIESLPVRVPMRIEEKA